jgi:hypothetical protein
MQISRWVSRILLLTALFIVGCTGATTTQVPTQGGPLPVVATLVVQTLTALNPTATATSLATRGPLGETSLPATAMPTAQLTATVSSTPLAPTTPSITPTIIPTVGPTAIPTQVFTPTATPVASQVGITITGSSDAPAAGCIDKAGFFGDVTIPDNTLLQKNTPFLKTWRIRNVGTCTWGDGYQFVFANGHIMGAPPSLPLPKAAPGDLIDISVNLQSPAEGGTFAGDWQFQNPAGKRFGVNSHGEDLIWVIIKVDWGPGVGPTATPPPVSCAYQHGASDEALLLQLINAARASKKLTALSPQSQLSAAALAHSADMTCNNYLDHAGSDGSNYDQRIRSQGYKPAYDSENIFAGGSAQDAFDWWMNSQVHRDNILSNKITQIGIGVATYAKSNFGTYYTLDFGRP